MADKKIQVIALGIGVPASTLLKCKLDVLGLDDLTLESLRGRKVLDIDCNDHGYFVYAARKRGIEAEGIGADAPNGDGFMKWEITASNLAQGSIMREDGAYDLVVGCPSYLLATAFSSYSESMAKIVAAGSPVIEDTAWRASSGLETQAKIALLEGLRVLRPNGLFICYPELDLLQGKMWRELAGYEVVSYGVPAAFNAEARLKEAPLFDLIFKAWGYEQNGTFRDFLTHRTVIKKTR